MKKLTRFLHNDRKQTIALAGYGMLLANQIFANTEWVTPAGSATIIEAYRHGGTVYDELCNTLNFANSGIQLFKQTDTAEIHLPSLFLCRELYEYPSWVSCKGMRGAGLYSYTRAYQTAKKHIGDYNALALALNAHFHTQKPESIEYNPRNKSFTNNTKRVLPVTTTLVRHPHKTNTITVNMLEFRHITVAVNCWENRKLYNLAPYSKSFEVSKLELYTVPNDDDYPFFLCSARFVDPKYGDYNVPRGTIGGYHFSRRYLRALKEKYGKYGEKLCELFSLLAATKLSFSNVPDAHNENTMLNNVLLYGAGSREVLPYMNRVTRRRLGLSFKDGEMRVNFKKLFSNEILPKSYTYCAEKMRSILDTEKYSQARTSQRVPLDVFVALGLGEYFNVERRTFELLANTEKEEEEEDGIHDII